MKKKINVLIDFFGEGILNLPVIYKVTTKTKQQENRLVHCFIDLPIEKSTGWLTAAHFSYSVKQDCNRLTISFNRFKGQQNVQYELMMNTVSEYINLREFPLKNIHQHYILTLHHCE